MLTIPQTWILGGLYLLNMFIMVKFLTGDKVSASTSRFLSFLSMMIWNMAIGITVSITLIMNKENKILATTGFNGELISASLYMISTVILIFVIYKFKRSIQNKVDKNFMPSKSEFKEENEKSSALK